MTSSQLAIVDGGPEPSPVQDLWEWVQEGFNIDKSATALIVVYKEPNHLSYLLPDASKQLRTPNSKCLEWTYEQIEAAALSLAAFLYDHGVRSADVVSTIVTNSLEYVVAMLASIRLGVVFAPLDVRELTHPETLQYQMRCTGTTVVVVLDEITASTFDDHVDKTLPVRLKIIFNQSEDTPEGWINLSNISTNIDSTQLPSTSNQQASDICVIGFTSGTTSLPKGVAWPIKHSVYPSHPKRTTDRPGHDPSARFALNTSNFRIVMRITLFDAWRCGASAVLPSPTFDPESLLRALKEQRCTHMYAIPTQLKMMTNLPNFESLRPESMRYIISNGDMTDLTSLKTIKDDFHAERVESAWGMTEAIGIYYTDHTPPPSSPEGYSCVGRPLPGTVVKICSDDGESGLGTPESRRPLRRGDDGHLHIRGPAVVHQYINDRDLEAFYDGEDGRRWFITGDMARMDDQGRIYIIGRSKDVIKYRGISLSPAAFESVLTGLPGIQQVSAFGLPSDLEGSVPVVVVECKEGHRRPELQTLNRALREQRADEYTLAAVYELRDLGFEDWPVNSNGKIMKRDLLKAVLRQVAC